MFPDSSVTVALFLARVHERSLDHLAGFPAPLTPPPVQIRMGELDVTGQHAGGPHLSFERLAPDPLRPGRFDVVENRHISLLEE